MEVELTPGKLYVNLKVDYYWLLHNNKIIRVGAKSRKEKEINHLIFLKEIKDKRYVFLHQHTICALTDADFPQFLRSWKRENIT